jgi:hypothetical protein
MYRICVAKVQTRCCKYRIITKAPVVQKYKNSVLQRVQTGCCKNTDSVLQTCKLDVAKVQTLCCKSAH